MQNMEPRVQETRRRRALRDRTNTPLHCITPRTDNVLVALHKDIADTGVFTCGPGTDALLQSLRNTVYEEVLDAQDEAFKEGSKSMDRLLQQAVSVARGIQDDYIIVCNENELLRQRVVQLEELLYADTSSVLADIGNLDLSQPLLSGFDTPEFDIDAELMNLIQ
jgi:hypothetical protein